MPLKMVLSLKDDNRMLWAVTLAEAQGSGGLPVVPPVVVPPVDVPPVVDPVVVPPVVGEEVVDPVVDCVAPLVQFVLS